MIPLDETGIPSASGSTLRPWLSISALFVILILGFCLRTWNINWGIPGIHPYLGRYMEALHPDEGPIVSQTADFVKGRLTDVKTLRYPPLHSQIGALLARLTGTRDIPALYLLARSVSVASSLGSIILLYFLGKRWNQRIALMACAFLSVSMVAVREAHWANPEPLSAFWILLACLMAFHLETHHSRALYFLLGASLALGVASKYFAALFLPLPLLAPLMTTSRAPANPLPAPSAGTRRRYRSNLPDLAISYGAFGLVALLTLGVYALMDKQLLIQAYQAHAPWAANNGLYGYFPKPSPVPSYSQYIFFTAMGPPLYLSSGAGIILSVFRRRKANLLLLGAIVPMWVFLELLHYHPLRFVLTLTPIFCLFAAYFFDTAMRQASRLLRVAALAAFAFVFLYSGIYAYGFIDVLSAKNDARLAASNWIEAHVPNKAEAALLGIDSQSNSLGFIAYTGMDRLAGKRFDFSANAPRFIVVPNNVAYILQQQRRLKAAGYNYTASDWWPLVAPANDTLRLYEDLLLGNGYRSVGEFDDIARFGSIQFHYERMKFDLALTNTEITIYERTP